MRFHTPPRNRGQIVEVSYAETGAGLVMRVVDRSDRSEYYKITPWTTKLQTWAMRTGPQNENPPTRRWSKKLTEGQMLRIVDE